MLVLALDTTTPAGSCALALNGVVTLEERSDPAREAAARLPQELMDLLARAGTTLAEIDVFAVATGPGSFTGLRIGIATMQGLAFAGGKPLVGVSGLDALAEIAGPRAEGSLVATWVDAWRGEVYAALYDQETQIEEPAVAPPGVLLPRLATKPVLFIGDGAHIHRDQILSTPGKRLRVAEVPLLAGTIALRAGRLVASGARPRPHAIRPLYVRRTDAEIARDARAAD
jgi:tRNA threonylcarbamoyladenosine biosynthesis protein TsaB